LQTKRFWILLYVHESSYGIDVWSGFSIVANRVLSNLGTDVVGEGVFHNFTHEKSQLRNGDMP
jgi:hypothetical protein